MSKVGRAHCMSWMRHLNGREMCFRIFCGAVTHREIHKFGKRGCQWKHRVVSDAGCRARNNEPITCREHRIKKASTNLQPRVAVAQ